ncbi:MAG TPA: hypothetical protein HA263_07270 [Methanoregulaceae archaeon]|nr:hypothetical protein [Methanoregulaceae archaeon]
MIPEATNTLVCVIQSGSATSSVWWDSIIGPIIGGILATSAGFLLTIQRERQEQMQRRDQIASGLLIELMTPHLALIDIPTSNRAEAQAAIWRLIEKYPGEIELYKRNGLIQAYYADIPTLGIEFTLTMLSLLYKLEELERLLTRLRNNPQERVEILEGEQRETIYELINRLIFMLEGKESDLRKIRGENIGILTRIRILLIWKIRKIWSPDAEYEGERPN